VCESGDTFGRGRLLPPLAEGDLVAIRSAGAYGFTMSSNYNGRPRAAEVLVHDGQAQLAREREQLTDLWRGERLLDGSPAPAVLPAPLRSFTKELP
jgi:diaminopimelate decarboxylase